MCSIVLFMYCQVLYENSCDYDPLIKGVINNLLTRLSLKVISLFIMLHVIISVQCPRDLN